MNGAIMTDYSFWADFLFTLRVLGALGVFGYLVYTIIMQVNK